MSTDVFSTKFAQDIYKQKYSLDGQEKWADTCNRVVSAVCGQLLPNKDKEKIYNFMLERKFIPGGRYLYSAGRAYHQVNNCHSGDTRITTDEGIFPLKDLLNEEKKVLSFVSVNLKVQIVSLNLIGIMIWSPLDGNA